VNNIPSNPDHHSKCKRLPRKKFGFQSRKGISRGGGTAENTKHQQFLDSRMHHATNEKVKGSLTHAIAAVPPQQTANPMVSRRDEKFTVGCATE